MATNKELIFAGGGFVGGGLLVCAALLPGYLKNPANKKRSLDISSQTPDLPVGLMGHGRDGGGIVKSGAGRVGDPLPLVLGAGFLGIVSASVVDWAGYVIV